MPILEELGQVRRRSRDSVLLGQGRRISVSLEEKRRISMGYDRFLLQQEQEEAEEQQQRHRFEEEHDRFRSELHRLMFDFTESRTFAGFILGVILLNTGILISQTWHIVAIRGGTIADHSLERSCLRKGPVNFLGLLC